MKSLIVFLAVGSIFATARAKGPVQTGKSRSLTEYAEEVVMDQAKGLAGVSVSLVDRSGILWMHNSGMASKANDEVLTEDTAMRLASISKVFTAIAVMQLAEQGKVELDRPYGDYVSGFEPKSHVPTEMITVRDLLTHRSGLPKDYYKGCMADSDESAGYRNLPQLLSSTFLIGPAGERYSYSNIGVGLLGVLIEEISGENFAEYINNHILSPLNMNHTSFLRDIGAGKNVATGHSDAGEADYEHMRDMPAGSLNASSSDMASFMISLLNGGEPVLRAGTLKKMLSPQAQSPIDGELKVGIVFFVNAVGGRLERVHTISHAGDLHGHHAILILLPDQGIGVTVMTNDEDGREAIAEIAQDLLSEAYERSTGSRLLSPEVPVVVTLPKERQETLSGLYVTSYDENIIWEIFTDKKGRLKVKIGDDELNLVAYEDDTFRLRSFMLNFLTFTGLIDDGIKNFSLKISYIEEKPYFYDASSEVFLSPITAVSIPDTWKQSIGTYRVQNATDRDFIKPGTSAEISLDATGAFLLIDGFPVNPVNDRYAVRMGKSSALGETIERLPCGSLHYSGFLFQKI